MSSAVVERLSFRGTSVGARLMLMNAFLMLALGVVSVVTWRALDEQGRAMSDLALISKVARYHQDADMLHATLRADVNGALASAQLSGAEREALERSIDENAMDLRRDLQALDKLPLPPDLTESQQKVRRIAEAFLSRAVEIGRLAIRDPRGAAPLLPAFNESIDSLRQAIDAQTQLLSQRLVKSNDDAASAAYDAKRWIVWAFVIAGIGIGLLVAFVSASIRSSLRHVRDVAHAMAAGDLQVRSSDATRDEIGQLARALNSMADSLSGMILKLRADADRDAFGTQLVEALEMADTEEEAHETIARAMNAIDEDRPMELLIADSSRAHLERATAHPCAGAPGCGVESPFSCVAVRRGNPVTFADSEALNACARLRGRGAPISAVCVPVSFMGRSLGVLHVAGRQGEPPTPLQVAQLTTLGIQAGARIGTVRAFQRTQRQATTDSLTGLYNRRTLEERARGLMTDGVSYAVVIADLDHFKRLNDTRGHEAGDNALRQFADVLRRALRGDDTPARWGGEEFVLLLPQTAASAALEVVERIRALLAEAQLVADTPAFTASFGVAHSSMASRFEQLVRIADDALYRAKEGGRDRAVLGDPAHVEPAMRRREVEHPAAMDIERIAR
ncbi:MAG: diguanylate cyclase [Proteobacteria bacterium]|nr:diguanylate cyclase [Pseudomonadota bacterium]